MLGYPDGLLPDNDEARFAVCDVIRRVKPDILITHHAHSMHKDHAACHRIVTDAWFYAAIEGFERDLPRHFARHLYYAEKTGRMPRALSPMSISTCPTASHSGEKAIEHHWFAVHSTSFPYKEYYSHLKRLRGIEGRKGYCECFMIPAEQMRIVKNWRMSE